MAYAKSPEIIQDKIVFSNGKTLKYVSNAIVKPNTKNNINCDNPATISQLPVIIDEWKRLILIETTFLSEGTTKKLNIYNYSGEQLAISPLITGEILFLKKTGRIMLAQQSAHYIVAKSFLMDINGNIIKEIKHPNNVFSFSHSEDEKVMWLLSTHIKKEKPFVRVKVFDFNGIFLQTLESFETKTINIDYENNSYKIHIPPPRVPG